MRLPVTSALGLSAQTIVTTVQQFVPVATAFLLPECGTILWYWLEARLAAGANSASYFPDWLSEIAGSLLTSVTFVAIIRHIVLAIPPKFLPSQLPWRAVLPTTLVLSVLWFALNRIADQSVLFGYYLDEVGLDAGVDASQRVYFILGLYSFVLHCILIAVVYPVLGPIAVQSRYDISILLRWHRTSFIGTLAFAALLVAAVIAARQAYWAVVSAILPDTLYYRPASLEFFDGRIALFRELLNLPADFVYAVVPAVAIGLLFKGLSKNTTVAPIILANANHESGSPPP